MTYRTIIWTRPGDLLGHCSAYSGEEPPDGFIWCEGGPIPDDCPELRELLNKRGFERLPDFRGIVVVSSQEPNEQRRAG